MTSCSPEAMRHLACQHPPQRNRISFPTFSLSNDCMIASISTETAPMADRLRYTDLKIRQALCIIPLGMIDFRCRMVVTIGCLDL
jgi:hypothetical protein